ncbi:hypothetical protein HK105_207514 [Polyrhizophydium stewartii]|uniref:Uncharacterized protein n=1 Tax=Polyrhizophydium stewartii TaxID=2732419 RepID=A0ABR4N0F0_9FUNG
MQPHDDRITIPSARLDTLRNLFKAAQEQAWNLASASSQEHSELAATKLALKRELSSLMRPAATSPQDIAADAAARQQARLALLADDDAVDIGHDVFSSVFVEVLAELSLPEPNDGASALDLALTIRALSAIETDLVRSCAGPAVTAAHRSLMLRRIDVMLSAHRLALTGKLLIDQLQFGADAICLIRDGFLRTVPAPMDAEPAVVDLDADMSHVATVPPEQGEAEQAQFVWVEWIREPTPPQKFAVTPDLTVAGLYRRLSSSNHFIEHWMFISPDPMSMRVVFDDNAFVHELLRQYPSSESEPWIARDRHSGMTPTEFLKSGVPKITRKRKQPSEKADHFNQARIKREASHQVTGMRVHKSLDKSSDYGRSPLNSSYSRSQTTSNEHDPQSFTLPEFLAAMDVWRMPDGRRDEIVTSGLQRCDLIVELSFKDSRHALASRAAM